ncbi:MAG: DNA polymerase III subunit delta [bacterium]
MSASQPVVTVLHGDDEFAITRECTRRAAMIAQDDPSGMNIIRLDGQQASQEDLRTALNTLPFLTEQRMVVLNAMPPRQDSKKFTAMLDQMPASTILVILLMDTYERKHWKAVDPEKHWLAEWCKTRSGQAEWLEFSLPAPFTMPGWLQKQAKVMGGKITPAAANRLAEWIGNDTRLAALELEKLLTYTNYERTVEVEDVEALSINNTQGNIFQFVDALAEHNPTQALNQLHRLMDEQEPVQIFSMIVRQFRLLLQVRELLDDGKGLQDIPREIPEIRASLVAEKMARQARRYDLEQLKEVYRRLLLVDRDLKTSQVTPELAFDLLVVELAGKG